MFFSKFILTSTSNKYSVADTKDKLMNAMIKIKTLALRVRNGLKSKYFLLRRDTKMPNNADLVNKHSRQFPRVPEICCIKFEWGGGG